MLFYMFINMSLLGDIFFAIKLFDLNYQLNYKEKIKLVWELPYKTYA